MKLLQDWRFKWVVITTILAAVPLFYLLPDGWDLFKLSNSGMNVKGVVVESGTPVKTSVYEYVVGVNVFVGGGVKGYVHGLANGPVKGDVVVVTYLPTQPYISCLGNASENFHGIAFLLALAIFVAAFVGFWISRHGLSERLFR